MGETVDVNVKGLVVAMPVFDRVSVTDLDGVNVFGNEVGIGEYETEVVVVTDTAGDSVVL